MECCVLIHGMAIRRDLSQVFNFSNAHFEGVASTNCRGGGHAMQLCDRTPVYVGSVSDCLWEVPRNMPFCLIMYVEIAFGLVD